MRLMEGGSEPRSGRPERRIVSSAEAQQPECHYNRFFVLPEGHTEQLAAPSITEGDKPLEPICRSRGRSCPRKKRMASSSLAGEASTVVTWACMPPLLPCEVAYLWGLGAFNSSYPSVSIGRSTSAQTT